VLVKEDLAKYPFTPEAQDFVKEKGLSVEELARPEYYLVLRRAIDRVREAVENGIVTAKLSEVEVEVLSYPAAVLLVNLSGDKYLQSRYAEGEAKRALMLLRGESPDKLAYLATHCFNWRVERVYVELGFRSYEFSILWRDYLSVAMGFKSPYWKLVNRVLSRGQVYLQRHELARLMAEALRERLLQRFSIPLSLSPAEPVKDALKEVVELGRLRVVRSTASAELPLCGGEEAYPPCIKSLMDDALAGRQLPHMARFTLASFMLSIGKGVEEVIDLFRRLPDFDEKRTSYHVRHIAGEIGSKTKYTPPSCDTMRTFNLCSSPDELCNRVKHPLTYYKIKTQGQREK